MSDSSRLKATIFVGALDMAVTSQTLHATFLPFGEIVDIQMPKPELPSSPDPHRGFGYVEFESAEDAREAIDNMNQSELFGRVIQVAQAKPIKDLSEGLGSKVAVWEQVRTTRGEAAQVTNALQEGWLAKHAVSKEDREAAAPVEAAAAGADPMRGLEELDVAGPKPE